MSCISAFKCAPFKKANVGEVAIGCTNNTLRSLTMHTRKATEKEGWEPAAMHNVNKLYHSENVKHNFNIIIYFLHATSLCCSPTFPFVQLCAYWWKIKLPARQQNQLHSHFAFENKKWHQKSKLKRFPERDACMQM